MQPIIPLSQFASVRDFQRYFQTHDQLRVPPGQCLEVLDISTGIAPDEGDQ